MTTRAQLLALLCLPVGALAQSGIPTQRDSHDAASVVLLTLKLNRRQLTQ